MLINYRIDRQKDGRYRVRRRSGLKDLISGDVLSIVGPGEPEIPDQPMTRQELYALLGDLAAKGYSDSLLP